MAPFTQFHEVTQNINPLSFHKRMRMLRIARADA